MRLAVQASESTSAFSALSLFPPLSLRVGHVDTFPRPETLRRFLSRREQAVHVLHAYIQLKQAQTTGLFSIFCSYYCSRELAHTAF